MVKSKNTVQVYSALSLPVAVLLSLVTLIFFLGGGGGFLPRSRKQGYG